MRNSDIIYVKAGIGESVGYKDMMKNNGFTKVKYVNGRAYGFKNQGLWKGIFKKAKELNLLESIIRTLSTEAKRASVTEK